MLKNFISIKLILFVSLISLTLSFGVMTRAYTKENFANRDNRFSKAYNAVVSKAIHKYGGFENAKVYPIAAYRNIENGVNYKMITAIEDDENKKVELMTSEVYTPFTENDSDKEETVITSEGKMPDVIEVENPIIIERITNFIQQHLGSENITMKIIKAIVVSAPIVANENFYLATAYVESLGESYWKYLVISAAAENSFNVIHTTDFLENYFYLIN